ncbi:vWA domain-containing protein [Zhongshania sp. BJYM1]|uniref:vWA domain-containing protein n=1 Tax=Zhongshania aquatica TaxID=2965069 RepID=UPI0022B2B2B3|nr:vWA domain-containing protein [Marortus sp. BJYM1]
MDFPRILLASVLCFSTLGITACDGNKNSSNGGGGSNTPPTVEEPSSSAAVSSEKANIALYGDIPEDKTKEVGENQPSLLLDDDDLEYAGFGMAFAQPEAAETAVARANADTSDIQDDVDAKVSIVTAALVNDGASVNQLVNKSAAGIEAAVAIVVLDVQYNSGGRSSADLRNTLLAELGSDADIAVLPLGSGSGREFRVSLAFWKVDEDLFTWLAVFSNGFAEQVKAAYGDVNSGVAVTSARGATSFVAASQSFTQVEDANNAADILWVIDNSGSMSEEQENLGNGIDQFFDSLNAAGLDFRLAVTTTDGSDCEELLSLPDDASANFISASTPDGKLQWGDDVNGIARPGTGGSANETGFYCADKVDLTGFDRESAPNIVVFVSDEPENESAYQSFPSGSDTDYDPRDFNTYKQAFIDSGATYFAISGPSSTIRPTFADPTPSFTVTDFNCSGEGGTASGGAHFREIASLTGGSSASICAPSASWSVMYDQIIQAATGLASSFKLDFSPLASSVVVKVNGVEVSRDVSHSDGFDVLFGSEEASIVFYGQAIPGAGDEIVVSYDHI